MVTLFAGDGLMGPVLLTLSPWRCFAEDLALSWELRGPLAGDMVPNPVASELL